MTTETNVVDLKELLTSSNLSLRKLLEARDEYFSREEYRKEVATLLKNYDKNIGNQLSNENQSLTRKAALFWLIGDTDNSLYILNSVSESKDKVIIKSLDLYDMGNHQNSFEGFYEQWKNDKQSGDLLYLSCVSAIRSKNDKASELVSKCSSLESQQKAFVEALYEVNFGDKKKALSLFEALLQQHPTYREALFEVAFLYDLYGSDDEAIELYEQLRLIRPLNVGVMINLGINYEDRGEYQKAIECYEAILDYYPNNKTALLYLKDALASLKMYYDEEAIRQHEKQKQLSSQSIVDLNLSTRTKNTLTKAGIYNLADLLAKTEEDLSELENVGQSMIKEIKDLLHTKNLHIYSLKELTPDGYISNLPLSIRAKPLQEIEFSSKVKDFIEEKGMTTITDILKMTAIKMKEEGASSAVIQEVEKQLKEQLNIRLLPGSNK